MSNYSSTLQTVLAVQSALIGELLRSGGGSAAEFMFNRPRKSGREIMAEALTGVMRSDAGMYRQAARNALEGKSIADILHTTAQGIEQSLSTMITALSTDPAAFIDSSSQTGTALRQTYDDALKTLKNVTGNAAYNGTKLLDGSTSNIEVYIGNTFKDIPLENLKHIFDNYYDSAGIIAVSPPADTSTALGVLADLNKMLDTMRLKNSSWQAMGAGFQTAAETVERQAKIYELTAARSILGARADPADRLLNALLSDQGKIMNFLA
ncbi:MAG: hypothetical protein LBQ51_11245 [Desulfovibrio sp.]|nr:hypothetical protein [Desulfovibrio sp.]